MANRQEVYTKQIFKINRSKDEDAFVDRRAKMCCNTETDAKDSKKKGCPANIADKEEDITDLESVASCRDVRVNSTGQATKKSASSLKCYKYVDGKLMPISSFSNTSIGAKKDITDSKDIRSNIKSEKKNPLSAFYYNGVESAFGSHCPPKNCKQRLRTTIVEGITKGKKTDEKEDRNHGAKFGETTKKFLWSGKGSKSMNKSFEKSGKEQNKSNFAERTSKNRKSGSSPLRSLGRSSLTIEPDKITISLPKYSPCASRLAASSKILSNDLGVNSDSPLHVARSRSPSRVDVQTDNNDSKAVVRTSMQASLSLNIQQFLKTKYAPRSKSVDDSCVTSPTSEATTLSYSPTGTEILSLGEVGPQTSSAEGSASYSEVKEKQVAECSDKVQRASLETKC